MNPQAMLIAIDGCMAQCAVAKELYDAKGVTDAPVQAIYASLQTMRLLVEQAPEDEDDVDETGHRHVDTERTDMGGGHYYMLCHDCDEIIEQA